MSSDKEVQMIMSLTGVDEKTASAAFLNHETMEDAIDSLLQKPVTQGDKYLPQKRKIETGLTPEQEERCKRGRWLQDQVNAVFSVAHSKTRTPQDAVVPSVSLGNPSESQSAEVPVASQLLQDCPEKTTQSTLRSESLP